MKLLTSEKADAEVTGHVIILGITILGLSMITLYGIPAIYSLEDVANVRNVEQTFTVLDSRASRAILGESPLQITNINLGGGTMTVEPNSTNTTSYMTVRSQNNTFNITIPMGKVKYTLGNRIVAYEGGGIWSKYPSGGTVMLSPPEFHYNGVTLTLPVINVSGNASTGGEGNAAVSFRKTATLLLYPDASFPDRTNPVNYTSTGKVYVNITSDFYDAWADYARGLLYTRVGENSTTRTTDIELTVVPSTLGENASINDPINFRGLNPDDDTPLENFSFRLEASTSPGLNNWQLRASSSDGKRKLIFYLDEQSGKLEIKVGYKDEGKGYADFAEVWEGVDSFPIINAGGGKEYSDVDLLNQSFRMKYEQEGIPTSNCGGESVPSGKVNGTAFTPMQTTVSTLAGKVINLTPSNPNNTQTLFNVTQHYVNLMAPDIAFDLCGPSSDPVDYGASTMLVNYNTTGALTYLQVTENKADVGIN